MEAKYPLQLFSLSVYFHVYGQQAGCCFMFPCGTPEILLCVRNLEGMMEDAGNLNTTTANCTTWIHHVIYSYSLFKKKEKKVLNGAVKDFKAKTYN